MSWRGLSGGGARLPRVREGEDVLVICNPATHDLGRAARGAAGAGAEAVLAVMRSGLHAAEPPRPIAEAMAAADVFLAPTVQSLSHTAARKAATQAGARPRPCPASPRRCWPA